MADETTRRIFLRKVFVGATAVAAAASGLTPLAASRADMLNQLAQHIIRIGYNVCRYTKF